MTYDVTVKEYRRQGFFCDKVSVLMAKTLSNVIKILVIIYINPIKIYTVINMIPNAFVEGCDNGYSIYMASTLAGLGHYDAIVDKVFVSEGDASSDFPQKPCTCGMNSNKEKEV